MIPNQLKLREVLNYYIPGLVLFVLIDILFLNQFDKHIVEYQKLTGIEIVVLLTFLYILGYILNASYGLMNYNEKKENGGKTNLIFRIIFGLQSNSKMEVYEKYKKIIDEKIKQNFMLKPDDLDTLDKPDIFYIVTEFVVNKSADKSTEELGRQIINSYFGCKLAFVMALCSLYFLFATLFKSFGYGYLPMNFLVFGFFISFVVERISWTLYNIAFKIWTGKVWRMFIGLGEKSDKESQKKGNGKEQSNGE